ncbi:CAF17-like 4Fe-4S cluster assembly/insertion protein YgfZ [Edaphobacter flagellatus]|uniref:CAF17-like 4Fe-4S cluster assembly/insertion protein YgfZ n=1 Tax=Edaphobacter flagellatus TaxID=1933044 RepID=UPI0021B21A71|nr:folate-binding protein [Edaphobacter flagellatus]
MTTAAASNTTPATEAQLPIPYLQMKPLLEGAGIAALNQTGWIRITGSDRVRWLNGMATNSIQGLALGQGGYNFFLNAQGRIQGDGYVFAAPIFASSEALFLETAKQQIPALIPYLDHYIIMDDVELADVTSDWHGITIVGPQAASTLAQLGLAVDHLNQLESSEMLWNSIKLTAIHAYSPAIPRFELWASTPADAEALFTALKAAGSLPCEPAAFEALRILEGTPLYGADIRDRDLPQETNQARALHFAKGCYLGQEIVERIRSRGNVHRTFTAFRLSGTVPARGTTLESAGKPVGELTSIVTLEDNQGQPIHLALGYARREALDRHEPLQYPGGTAQPVSIPPLAEIQLAR